MPLPSIGLPAAEAAPPSRSSSCCVEEPGREPAAEQPADAPSADAEPAVQVAQPRAAPPSRRLSVAAPVAAPAATALRAAASMTSWHAAIPLEALTAQQTSARGRPQSGSIASGAAHQQPHSAPSRNTSSAQELVVRPPATFKSQSAALRQVADLFEEDMHFALSQAPRAAPLRAGKKAALSAAKPQLLEARKPALASPRSSSGSSEHIPAIRGEAATTSGLVVICACRTRLFCFWGRCQQPVGVCMGSRLKAVVAVLAGLHEPGLHDAGLPAGQQTLADNVSL